MYKGKYNNDTDVAIKTLKEGASEEDRVKFLQEAAIMGQFKHVNVVAMHGVITDKELVIIIYYYNVTIPIKITFVLF